MTYEVDGAQYLAIAGGGRLPFFIVSLRYSEGAMGCQGEDQHVRHGQLGEAKAS
jgi:hypothetical protein